MKLISLFKEKMMLMLVICLASFSLFGCDSHELSSNELSKLERIQISPNSGGVHGVINLSLLRGNDLEFKAEAIYSDGKVVDVTNQAVWQVDDTAIARISSRGVLTGAIAGNAIVSARLDGVDSNTITVSVTDPVITAIQLTPNTATIAKGLTQQLTAMATLSDGTTAEITSRAVWVVADNSVVTVTNTGLLSASSLGNTTVIAKLDGVDSNSIDVEVTSAVVASIQLTPANNSLAKGLTQQLTASATLSDGTVSDVTSSVTWTVAQSATASVSSTGLLTADNVGTTTVRASLNLVTSNAVTVEVTDAVVAAIQATPVNNTIAKGLTQQLNAVATMSDGTANNVTASMTWIVADNAIATVSSSGLLTAAEVGTTTITGRLNGVDTNLVNVEVTAASVRTIQVTPPANTMAKGVSQQLVATATLTDGSSRVVTSTVAWNSVDTNIASVSSMGLVTAANVGDTTVSARLDGVDSNAVNISVTNAVVASIQLTPATNSLAKGLTQQLVATATLTDSITNDVSNTAAWLSSDPSIATVSTTGLVTAVGVGDVVITASSAGITSSQANVTVTAAVTTALVVMPNAVSIPDGLTQQLQATATLSDGQVVDVTSLAAWSGNDIAVASVSSSGLLTAVDPGTTSVMASYDSIDSAAVSVEVTSASVDSIAVTPVPISLAKGLTQQMIVTATLSDTTNRVVTHDATWTVADSSVATISPSGLLTAVSVGSTTAIAQVNGVASSAVNITVTNAVIKTISVTPDPVALVKGSSRQLTAVATYTDSTTRNITGSASWAVADTAIATISNTAPSRGFLSTVAAGNTTVTATQGGITSNVVTLAVTEPRIVSLSISAPVTQLHQSSQLQFIAQATYDDGDTADITTSVDWAATKYAINSDKNSFNGLLNTADGIDPGTPGTVTVSASVRDPNNGNAVVTADSTIEVTVIAPVNRNCYSQVTVNGLTYSCPSNGFTSTEGRVFTEKGANGINGQRTNLLNYAGAEAYCTAVGGRLPTLAELEALFDTVDGVVDSNYRLYTQYGYPTFVRYWSSSNNVADATKKDLLGIGLRNTTAADPTDVAQIHYALCIL